MDAQYYDTLSYCLWERIYDYHISMMTLQRQLADTFMGAYLMTFHSHALRDMERQALLAELRRANWQPTYTRKQSTALVASP